MKCPHCGEEHDPEKGRFCDACGRSVVQYTRDPEEEAAPKTVHCRHCGSPSPPPICVACGSKLPLPED